MKLTKDNLVIFSSGKAHWLQTPSAIKEYCEELRNQILKNQEDAEQWKFYYDGGLNGLLGIKESLIKLIDRTFDDEPIYISTLQKILKVQNDLSKQRSLSL